MHNQILRAVTAAALILVGTITAAHASPIYYAIASAVVTDHAVGGAQDSDSTGLVNNSDSAGPVSAELSGGFASASVTDGSLHAFATSTSLGFSANGTASFFDTLLLTSATLAPGTPVSLFGELAFTYTISSTPGVCGAVAYAGIDTGTSSGNAGSLFVQDVEDDTACGPLDTNTATGLIQGIIGEELTVNAFINAGVGAFGGGTVDASNTLRFFLTPIGDFTYSTASGNNYINQVQPVPEPSSLLLFGSGLTFAVSRLRRRSTRG